MPASSISIVVRMAGERTAERSLRLVRKAFPSARVYRIAAPSVHAAFVEAATLHVATGARWALNIDGDCLVARENILRLMANLDSRYSEVDIAFPRCWCQLHGGFAFVGVLVLNQRVLETALTVAGRTAVNLRPDVAVVEQLRARGFRSVVINDVVALHDWNQFYAHVFIKMFNRARRSQSTRHLHRRFQLLSDRDPEAKVALAGVEAGLAEPDRTQLRWMRDFENLAARLEQLGVVERAPLEESDPCPDPDTLLSTVRPDCTAVSWRVDGDTVRLDPGSAVL